MVELLGLGIRQNELIRGVELNGQEIKSGQYTDDLWTALVAEEQNINAVLEEIEQFSHFSGLVINPEKCAVMKIGPWRNTEARYYTLKWLYWSPDSIKILGIYLNPEWEIMQQQNYFDVLVRIHEIVSSWQKRSLTIMGKIVIINSLINSLLTHKFLSLPSP